MTSHKVSCLVVGGGIGGLTAALALARRGRDVQVLEKADAFTEIGAGLQLAPNATRVLTELGVMDALMTHAVAPARLLWMDALAEKPITAVDLGAPFRRHFGYPYLVMHRGDLLTALLEACRASGRGRASKPRATSSRSRIAAPPRWRAAPMATPTKPTC